MPKIVDITKSISRFTILIFLLFLLFFCTGYLFLNEIQEKADFAKRSLLNLRYINYRKNIQFKKLQSKLIDHIYSGEPFVEREFAYYTGNISVLKARAEIFYDLMKHIYPAWAKSGIFKFTDEIFIKEGKGSL